MKRYEQGTEDFDRQTAVMDSLPHAIHPIHDDWRTKADALIEGLFQRGWRIVRADVPRPADLLGARHDDPDPTGPLTDFEAAP